jgi:NhaA family Na+:H+ antiporter
MTTHAMHLRHSTGAAETARRPTASGILHFITGHYLLLPIGACVALVWANTAPESYFTFARVLAFPVNAIAMVFFFGLVAQEIFEEMMPGGALHNRRRWPVPLIAAAGGTLGAAATYAASIRSATVPMLLGGWPITAGIDLVFAYFIVRAIFHRHPAVPFLLVLAVASNAIGFIALAPAFLFDAPRAGGSGLLMAAAVGLAVWLRRKQIRAFWPYVLVCGALSWFALYLEGFPPALALAPIVPFMPHTRRRLGELFDDEIDATGKTPRHYEHVWHYHVQIALLLFGLVNAGVMVTGYGEGSDATLLAALGRTAGILLSVAAALAVGLYLPAQLSWRELIVVALASTIGLTFALYFAIAVFPAGPLLAEIKVGALLTAVGLPLAFGAARLLRVGRFEQRLHSYRR